MDLLPSFNLLILLFLVSLGFIRAQLLGVDVTTTGNSSLSFSVAIDGNVWLSSYDGDIYFRHNRTTHSTSAGNLVVKDVRTTTGTSALGIFNATTVTFVSTTNGKAMDATIQQYASYVVFDQTFLSPLMDCSIENADALISSFPSFQLGKQSPRLGFAHWISWLYLDSSMSMVAPSSHHRKSLVAPGFQSPVYGEVTESSFLPGGIGGSGPTILFNEEASISVVISPLNEFMAASHISPGPGSLQYGIMGNVSSVPKDFSLKTILVVTRGGINEGMKEFGKVMRGLYGKKPASESKSMDITLTHLGYSTDNGMYYYYYNTNNGSSYEDTLIAVKDYSVDSSIPYAYVLLDSWWYFKGSNGGVSNWKPMPDVFPKGLDYLFNATGWFVQAHNRYWAQDNVYAKENGGLYDFVLDSIKDGGVPIDHSFWSDLFEIPSQTWGLAVYEQDWLFNEFYEYVSQMMSSITLGRDWLLQMGKGAARRNITIQYCMPFVRHLMQSLEIQSVTQARASDDYVVSPYDGYPNWKIGGQTMLIDALGLSPSKDGFWSSSYQSNNPYGVDRFEPCPRLQSLVTTLSCGPVAVGDGIGYTDTALLNRSIRKDGRLLQASSPAMKIDAQFLQAAFRDDTKGPSGEVWFARSAFGGGFLFATELEYSWVVSPQDLGLPSSQEYRIFEANTTDIVGVFSEQYPLLLKSSSSAAEFQYFTISPVVNGWSFLGEQGKWISQSQARFSSVAFQVDVGPVVTANIVKDEQLIVRYVKDDALTLVECPVPTNEDVTVLIYPNGKCTFAP
jgi:hypothetical protein